MQEEIFKERMKSIEMVVKRKQGRRGIDGNLTHWIML